jgi:hypothetical protein
MSSSQALAIGVTVLVILASSGCIGGGRNAQTFDTGFGQIQIEAPGTLVPTIGSISSLGMLSLGKKDGNGMPLLIITLKKSDGYSNFQNAVSMAKLMTPLDERD